LCGSDNRYYERASLEVTSPHVVNVVGGAPLSSVKIDSLATSGQIPENLDEAVRLAKRGGVWITTRVGAKGEPKVIQTPRHFVPFN
jgi:hypothetical protein